MDLASLSQRFEELPNLLWTLITDPTSNLVAALLLYAVIGVGLLIVLMIAIIFLVGDDDDIEVVTEDGEAPAGGAAAAPGAAGASDLAREPAAEAPRPRRSPLATAVFTIAVIAAVWAVTGYSTSADPVCVSCHAQSVHADAAQGADPHESSDCVACHESGGTFDRLVGDVPPRLIHFIDGSLEEFSMGEDYGRITQRACFSCHADQIAATVTDEERGLIVSHAEPLEAGVRCLDCHTPVQGIVSVHNAGMNPCLRCHDSRQASADCDTCHDRAAAAAARSEVTTAFARIQVPDVTCGGCHDEKRECDTCHGTRMPHTKDFMVYAHARAGAVDFWYNGGRGCAKCHTAERRPCQRCHGPTLGQGHGPPLARDHVYAQAEQCNSCHQRWAYSPQRDYCRDVCHTPAAERESPR